MDALWGKAGEPLSGKATFRRFKRPTVQTLKNRYASLLSEVKNDLHSEGRNLSGVDAEEPSQLYAELREQIKANEKFQDDMAARSATEDHRAAHIVSIQERILHQTSSAIEATSEQESSDSVRDEVSSISEDTVAMDPLFSTPPASTHSHSQTSTASKRKRCRDHDDVKSLERIAKYQEDSNTSTAKVFAEAMLRITTTFADAMERQSNANNAALELLSKASERRNEE